MKGFNRFNLHRVAWIGAAILLLEPFTLVRAYTAQVEIHSLCREFSCIESPILAVRLLKQNSARRPFEVKSRIRNWKMTPNIQNYKSSKSIYGKVSDRKSKYTDYESYSTFRPSVDHENKGAYTNHVIQPGGKNLPGFLHAQTLSITTAKRTTRLGYISSLISDNIDSRIPSDLIPSTPALVLSGYPKSLRPRRDPNLGPAFITMGLNKSMQRTKKYHQAVLRNMRSMKNMFGHNLVQMQVISYEPGRDKGFSLWIQVNCTTNAWKYLDNLAILAGGRIEMFGQVRTNEMGKWACNRYGLSY